MGSKSKVEDAGRRVTVEKSEFAEVPVVGDKGALLGSGQSQHLHVWYRCRIVLRNDGNFMVLCPQKVSHADVDALVKKELYECAGWPSEACWAARLGRMLPTSTWA